MTKIGSSFISMILVQVKMIFLSHINILAFGLILGIVHSIVKLEALKDQKGSPGTHQPDEFFMSGIKEYSSH